MEFHTHLVAQVLSFFGTDVAKGLGSQEARRRIQEYGFNILGTKKRSSLIFIFLNQFIDPLIYLLLACAALIFYFGDPLDACVISGVLLFNAVVGTVQEFRTGSMIGTLQSYLKTDVVVVRDGQKKIISDELLVPGDIFFLRAGEKVQADARIIRADSLSVDESMLTGESTPVFKNNEAFERVVPVFDRTNMLFRGTYLFSGTALAVVVATGDKTEIGAIKKELDTIQTETPLQKEIEHLTKWILGIIFVVCGFLFAIGFAQGKSFAELFVMLTALFICIVPEGLPVVLTLALVTGAHRMAKKNILAKRLQAVEGLGRADVIIMDKTGTLTQNKMVVTRAFFDDTAFEVTGAGYSYDGSVMVDGVAVANDHKYRAFSFVIAVLDQLAKAQIEYSVHANDFKVKGDPTEAALYVFAKKMMKNSVAEPNTLTPIAHIPFAIDQRMDVSFFKNGEKVEMIVSGAPEVVVEKSHVLSSNAKKAYDSFLHDGLRTIAFAQKTYELSDLDVDQLANKDYVFSNYVQDLTFLGFLGLEDSVRPESTDTIKKIEAAGVRVIMATGDHEKTALSVAKQVGLFEEHDTALSGADIAAMSDDDLKVVVEQTSVFYRVTPGNKHEIVKALQSNGNIVAMTGDGINDALSLVSADLGIAMGGVGTEVAKQAADLILLQDSFGRIVDAIKQGRHIFYSLRRVVIYFFTTNLAEVLIVLLALLFHYKLPLLPAQILWLNLIADGFLDTALAMEPSHKWTLNRDAREKRMHLIDWSVLYKVVSLSLPMAMGTMAAFCWYQTTDLALARTMALVTMTMFQWMNVWNARSERFTVFQIGLFSNRWLLFATGAIFVLQLLLVYNPLFQTIFKTVPLSGWQWFFILLISGSLFIFEEIKKIIAQYKLKTKLTS